MKLKSFFYMLSLAFWIDAQHPADFSSNKNFVNSRIEAISYPEKTEQLIPTVNQADSQRIIEPNSFDIEKMKKQFQDYDCLQKFKDNDLAMQQCLNKLEQIVFSPFEGYTPSNTNIYNSINRDIYIPLAYNSLKQSSFADIIKELIFKTNKDNLLSGQQISLNFDDFQNSVIKTLSSIENKSDYNNENQQDVIDGVVNILKDFHIYWNAMRLRNQVNQASENTVKVVENIIKKYQVKESFMFQLTKLLLLKLEANFQKFITAHYSLQILKSNVAGILGNQISKRYLGLAEKYSQQDISDIKDGYYTNQTSVIIDFAKIYLINQYKEHKDIKFVKKDFENEIIEKIKDNYSSLSKNLFQNEKKRKQVTHATATLLLKLKHIYFIFFNYNDINEVLHGEQSLTMPSKSLTVKIYYELMDNMVLLPNKCLDAIDLSICVYKNANRVFNYIKAKYGLQYSRSGQIIYRYIRRLMQEIFQDASKEDISNLNLLKKFYYKKLFAKLFEYKVRFKIKDTMELDDLETQVGDMMMAYKLNTEDDLVHIDYKILDQLDMDIYNKFLTIKSKFDDYVPLYQDKLAILEVYDILNQFLDIYKERYNVVIDKNFSVLIEDLKKLFDHWKMKMLQEYQKEHKKPQIEMEMIKKYPELFNLKVLDYSVSKENINDVHNILGNHEVQRQIDTQKKEEYEKELEEKKNNKNAKKNDNEKDEDFVPYNVEPFHILTHRTDLKPLKLDYKEPTNRHIVFKGKVGVLGDSNKGPDNIPSDIQHAEMLNDYDLNPEHTVINNDSIGDIGLADGIQEKVSHKY